MDDKDRVFARFQDDKPAPSDRRELLTIPRRAGATGSRVVEVVHMRSGAAPAGKERPRRIDTHVRAASWEDGFPAREVPTLRLPAEAAPPEAQPTAHVMPAWVPIETTPSVEAKEVAATTVVPVAVPDLPKARKTTRRIADPFDSADDGANCMRCGYAIEPAREKRGLLTCAACA